MIKLAQDHSANQGYTCALGSRHEDYLLVFFPFVLLDTMLGTLSISNPFHLLNSYWSFKTQLKGHLLHESSWVFSALFLTWVRCIWRRLHPSLFPLTPPSPLPGSRHLQSREDLGLVLGCPVLAQYMARDIDTEMLAQYWVVTPLLWFGLVNDVIWLTRRDFSSRTMPFSQIPMNSFSLTRSILGQVVTIIRRGTITSCTLCLSWQYCQAGIILIFMDEVQIQIC